MDNASIKVSILLVNFNQKSYIDDCLVSILDQSFPKDLYEVTVLDNQSTDDSVIYLHQKYPLVNVVCFEKNLGYYGAITEALPKAKGKYIVILPFDTIVHRNFISEFFNTAELNDKIVICMSNTINPDAPDYVKKDRLGDPEFMYVPESTIFGNPAIRKEPYSPNPIKLLMSSGVSFLIRKDFHEASGEMFDLYYSHYNTDLDTSLRASILGYTVVFVPGAIVYHIDENKKKLTGNLLSRYFIGSRDRLLTYYKTMNTFEFILALPLLLLGIAQKVIVIRSSIRLAIKFLLTLVAFCLAPAALLAALIQLPKFSQKRQFLLDRRVSSYFGLLSSMLNKYRENLEISAVQQKISD